MEKGDPEMGLQHLAQAAQLAQLLQRATAQRVPITLPNAQEGLELGAAHMASIVMQCRLRAKELGEDLCEVDFDGELGRLSVNDLSPKLQRMQELVVRFFDSTQAATLSADSALGQMCSALEELMALHTDPEARPDDFIREVRAHAVTMFCIKLREELESSWARAAAERRQDLSQVFVLVRASPLARS